MGVGCGGGEAKGSGWWSGNAHATKQQATKLPAALATPAQGPAATSPASERTGMAGCMHVAIVTPDSSIPRMYSSWGGETAGEGQKWCCGKHLVLPHRAPELRPMHSTQRRHATSKSPKGRKQAGAAGRTCERNMANPSSSTRHRSARLGYMPPARAGGNQQQGRARVGGGALQHCSSHYLQEWHTRVRQGSARLPGLACPLRMPRPPTARQPTGRSMRALPSRRTCNDPGQQQQDGPRRRLARQRIHDWREGLPLVLIHEF